MKSQANFNEIKNQSFKIKLCFTLSLTPPFKNNLNNNCLISNFSDIENLLSMKKPNMMRFIFINQEFVHKLLYESEELIEITGYYLKNLSDLFYFDLLIKYNTDIIDYCFSLSLVENISNLIKKENSNIKNIIISMIIIDLINYYVQTNGYDKDKDDEKIILIKNNNLNVIENNIKNFKIFNIDYSKNDILSKNIDDIYIEMINSLIISNKFKDFEYFYKILNQLDLESIYLTDNMLEKLKETLDISNDYIKNYTISDINDLFNIEKVNFYFTLLKYILKNSFYIYQFPLLLTLRNKIIKIINNDNDLDLLCSLKENKDDEIIEKIDFIIKILLDSEYYYNKYFNNINLKKLKEVLLYYKQFLFESKKEDINIIEKLQINSINDKKNVIDNYLKDYDIAKKNNNRLPIINYLFNINNINENEMCKYANDWKEIEKMIIKNSYKKIANKIKSKIVNYFYNKDNKKILLKIFQEEDCKIFIENNKEYKKKNDDNKEEKKAQK